MDSEKIAVMVNNLRMDPYEGMNEVVKMGVRGLHISADGGPFAVENLDAAARRELLKHINSLGLEVSALSAWGGQVHLENAEDREENVAWARELLQLAVDLECGIWQAHVGVMPDDPEDPGWKNTVAAMREIAEYGEQLGACMAIETGPEPPRVLKRLIDTVGSEAIRVNYDPANLLLWPPLLVEEQGTEYNMQQAIDDFQPNEGAKLLGPYVVHTHAKDARVWPDGRSQEVPLGEGLVDWPRYVKYLQEAGYDGYFAIEREAGEDPLGDVQRAVQFLRTL